MDRTSLSSLVAPGLAVALALGAGVAAAPAGAAPQDPPLQSRRLSEDVTFMTRNIYLGADLKPAFEAKSLAGFIDAVGEIFNTVKASNMPVRSKGLADEILRRQPDVVGLQEAALWRTGPLDINAITTQQPKATHVYQDFIKILMKRLNRHGKQYRVVSIAPEFDFEAPADTDGNTNTGPFMGADMDVRLTMRDAILVRRHAGVRIDRSSVKNGHFTKANSFVTNIFGIEVQSVRGWQRMNLKVRNSPWFRYGNVHTEAFDDRTVHPSIRARQTQEFADAVRVHQGRKPLVASGDFNSDFPGLVPGDEQGYLVMRKNGFFDIGTKSPWSCCVANSDDMHNGGSTKDFDHRVDQFWTNTRGKVETLQTWVTGRHRAKNGYWDSDHAGVVIRARITGRTPTP